MRTIHRTSLRRHAVRILLTPLIAAAVGLQPSVLVAPAAAAEIDRCTGQDRVVERSARVVSKRFTLTHGDQIDLARGVAYKTSATIARTNVLTASASGSVEASGGADWKVARLDAKVAYSLALAGEHTAYKSKTEEFTVPERDRQRLFLFYRGNVLVKGRWYQLTCSRVPGRGTEAWGGVKSYHPIARHGVILCNRNAYKKGSLRYRIAVQGGC